MLRYGRTGELARELPEWVGLFAQVQAAPEGTEQLRVVIRYLLWTGDKAVHDSTGQVLHSVLDEQRTEELMRSYGEELIEQGRQQGLAQGLAQGLSRGRAEGILRILNIRGIHVEEGVRQRILDCTDVDTLDSWFDRALQSTSLSEVLDGEAHASRRKDS
ncbi:hypothetical protein D187_000122 [Cystobacter fuscus DSM 2262]|uniref:Uncharacterized protein n=1 Tax=Cystobacter fuscus (strain ATCC 25194 / DSM 2262 / NBRC 100088 / M29) TaxID=1242864 RepID=S9PKD4_CYSF2|nr:hypothetical protein D187_000122 [Cystobacter fuscus DSM 2262]